MIQTSKIDDLRYVITKCEKEIDTMKKFIKTAIKKLRMLEWSWYDMTDRFYCGVCANYRFQGHTADCEFEELISDMEEMSKKVKRR